MHRPGLGHEPMNVDRVLPRGLVLWIGRAPRPRCAPADRIIGIVLERDQPSGGLHRRAVELLAGPSILSLDDGPRADFARTPKRYLPGGRTRQRQCATARGNQLVRHGDGNAEVDRDLRSSKPPKRCISSAPQVRSGSSAAASSRRIFWRPAALSGRGSSAAVSSAAAAMPGRRSWLPRNAAAAVDRDATVTRSGSQRLVGWALSLPPLRTLAMLPVRRPRRASRSRRPLAVHPLPR